MAVTPVKSGVKGWSACIIRPKIVKPVTGIPGKGATTAYWINNVGHGETGGISLGAPLGQKAPWRVPATSGLGPWGWKRGQKKKGKSDRPRRY